MTAFAPPPGPESAAMPGVLEAAPTTKKGEAGHGQKGLRSAPLCPAPCQRGKREELRDWNHKIDNAGTVLAMLAIATMT